MNNCIRITAAFALLVAATQAQAAGGNKVKIFTVSHATLGGYVAVPPAGWRVGFQFFPVSPSTATAQEFLAVSSAGGSATTLPPSVVINRINSAGVRLSTDALPAAAQVTQADCTPTCPQVNVQVGVASSNPGRIIVNAVKNVFNATTKVMEPRFFFYLFDPSTTVAADRWMPIINSTYTSYPQLTTIGGWTAAAQNFYVFDGSVTGSTTVYQLVNK